MKIRLIVLTFTLFAAGCSNDEFDDTRLLEDLSGIWFIETPYIGLTVDGDYSKLVPVDYPDYEMGISEAGEVTITRFVEGTPELIATGKVSATSGKTLVFDEAISNALNEIGYFESAVKKKYSIIMRTSTSLEINYTFKNSSGQPQDEGFELGKFEM